MRVGMIFIVVVFVLSLTGCARSPESSIERRIGRIERGLLSAYSDPPWKRMELVERMTYYNVPGVSIAVINDFQIEWARGYGVLEAGRRAASCVTLCGVPSGGRHRRVANRAG